MGVLKDGIRKNVYMSKDLADFIEEKAEILGISQSAYIIMAVKTYMDQQRSMDINEMALKQFKEQKDIK